MTAGAIFRNCSESSESLGSTAHSSRLRIDSNVSGVILLSNAATNALPRSSQLFALKQSCFLYFFPLSLSFFLFVVIHLPFFSDRQNEMTMRADTLQGSQLSAWAIVVWNYTAVARAVKVRHLSREILSRPWVFHRRCKWESRELVSPQNLSLFARCHRVSRDSQNRAPFALRCNVDKTEDR